jgi:hypothetical protein
MFSPKLRRYFKPLETLCPTLMLLDPAAFHITLSAAAASLAHLKGLREDPKSVQHNAIAIRLLNERLRDQVRNVSDGTIAAVLKLAAIEVRIVPLKA